MAEYPPNSDLPHVDSGDYTWPPKTVGNKGLLNIVGGVVSEIEEVKEPVIEKDIKE